MNNEFKKNNLECKVGELRTRLIEIDLENELKMLEAEMRIKSSSKDKNQIMNFFVWYKKNYPHYEFNDILVEHIETYVNK